MTKKIRTPLAAIMLLILVILRIICHTDLYIFNMRYGIRFDTIAPLIIFAALTITLFAKKFNTIPVIVLGAYTFVNFIILILHFSLYNIINLLVVAALTTFALSVCEQNLIKTDLSKIKQICCKFYYLPAALYMANELLFRLIAYPSEYISETFFIPVILPTLTAIAFLNLGMWLKDPYAKEKPVNTNEGSTNEGNTNSGTREHGEEYYDLCRHTLLLLFTFGIWYFIWTYRTTKNLNNAPNTKDYNPTAQLLLCMFIPFYSIYWLYKHGEKIDSLTKAKGYNHSEIATPCLILGIFSPFAAYIVMQDRINTLYTK